MRLRNPSSKATCRAWMQFADCYFRTGMMDFISKFIKAKCGRNYITTKMKKILLLIVSLLISFEVFGKGGNWSDIQINSTPEYLCDNYGRLSITVDQKEEGVFLINSGSNIREMYFCGHFCDYIVNDSTLIYQHGNIYWDDEWEIDSEQRLDTIIEVRKSKVIGNVLREICRSLNIHLADITMGETFIDFQPYLEIFSKQLTEKDELENELLHAYHNRTEYRQSKLVESGNVKIPYKLEVSSCAAPKYLFEFSDVVSNMIYVRLRELSNNNCLNYLVLLDTNGSIKKITAECGNIVAKHDNNGYQFKANHCRQDLSNHIIGDDKIGYCVYDKHGGVLFRLDNIQKQKVKTKWRYKADYCSVRVDDTILSYRNGILYYDSLSRISYADLDSVAITDRRKADVVAEMRMLLAKRLDVNAENISLCDTIIQFKPEHFDKKLPASKHIEKELLLSYKTRIKSIIYNNWFHNELNEIKQNYDTIYYRLHYSEFVDNMIYAEVESQKLKGRLKVLFMLDNKGIIKEYIIDSSIKIAGY